MTGISLIEKNIPLAMSLTQGLSLDAAMVDYDTLHDIDNVVDPHRLISIIYDSHRSLSDAGRTDILSWDIEALSPFAPIQRYYIMHDSDYNVNEVQNAFDYLNDADIVPVVKVFNTADGSAGEGSRHILGFCQKLKCNLCLDVGSTFAAGSDIVSISKVLKDYIQIVLTSGTPYDAGSQHYTPIRATNLHNKIPQETYHDLWCILGPTATFVVPTLAE